MILKQWHNELIRLKSKYPTMTGKELAKRLDKHEMTISKALNIPEIKSQIQQSTIVEDFVLSGMPVKDIPLEDMVSLSKHVYMEMLKNPEVDFKTKEKICSTVLSGTQVFVKKTQSEESGTKQLDISPEIKKLLGEIKNNAEERTKEIEANTITIEPEGEAE